MNHIGASHPRHDALDKVTGAANYPADLIGPGMLRLKTVFARRGHARIRSIDASAALAVPGVVAVLTAKDVPHNRYGLIDSDQPVLCDDTVRHDGDRVALVVAETDLAAAHAATLVRVDYEDLPIVGDPYEAMKPGAQRVHHDRDNVLLHQQIRRGDTARAPQVASIVNGCRLWCPMIDSSRLQRIATARRNFQAASAARGWTERSSRPPNAPPILA